MGEYTAGPLRAAIEAISCAEARHVKATLIRLLGDFDLAEEAMQDAFAAALAHWPRDGVPPDARAWLVSAGYWQFMDRVRGSDRSRVAQSGQAGGIGLAPRGDDWLRLIFICCHPALPCEARVALTLRELCGLSVEATADALLSSTSVVERIVGRAKHRIRELRLPYVVPAPPARAVRLDRVLQVIRWMFNEGYFAPTGAAPGRVALSAEAIRLCRLLGELLPEAEVRGLLAWLLLAEARRPARTTADGEAAPLAEQDRSRWDAGLIAEGRRIVAEVSRGQCLGPYALQAAIAAVHAEAACTCSTDWARIACLYDALLSLAPSLEVALNRAVAVALRDGAGAGLALLDALRARGGLGTCGAACPARLAG